MSDDEVQEALARHHLGITPEAREAALANALDAAEREAARIEEPMPHEQVIFAAVQAALLSSWRPQWLPIESAPKDGTFVMLWLESAAYCPTFGCWRGDGWGDELITFTHPGLNEPTHWAPLPAPPSGDPP